jgi:hypothetical protein
VSCYEIGGTLVNMDTFIFALQAYNTNDKKNKIKIVVKYIQAQ